MKIGVIADDFTGATDAASFIVKGGMSAIQLSGIQDSTKGIDVDALVVSLKSRSCDVNKAVKDSLEACDWLLDEGCDLIYFKYCSTFDSTEKGNIGPVVEALKTRLSQPSVLLCPALPVNGRTVYQGHLFVFDRLLSESGMRSHPITPMTESNLLRVIGSQSAAKAGLISWHDIAQQRIKEKQAELELAGKELIICDSVSDEDLERLAEVAQSQKLVSGGSGLVGAIAKTVSATDASLEGKVQVCDSLKGVVLSGSCSEVTNEQVNSYKEIAPSLKLDVSRCLNDETYLEEVLVWVVSHTKQICFPMVYATVRPDELANIQSKFGQKASIGVEALFHQLVKKLYGMGFNTFISAGGETSGTVTQALSIESFRVGQEIAPGVPWMSSIDGEVWLALKSGNFGDVQFFEHAQEQLR
ncbi:3-oxo-tetronate kinase [Vibrio superstes]|uniref:3-oxo-tetronate kinase n=1 Tax=Vibrio superstes NBRC 103154 TaxID=1219062 RepID=A0A511QKY6_9VIBR|nr:3-oxo-tetronate kinase [Vibrio superstes]GEM77969.1 membrane protein [Vibrio superstes NBRC 103154]